RATGGESSAQAPRSIAAQGRRSVSVDFPVEGDALYFEKLKDHAELSVTSIAASDSKRLFWLLLLIAITAILWGGERLIVKKARRQVISS
ncbi:MAG: hypothetical protein AAF357_05650, partial [Verrucomicrobiota bacterium]